MLDVATAWSAAGGAIPPWRRDAQVVERERVTRDGAHLEHDERQRVAARERDVGELRQRRPVAGAGGAGGPARAGRSRLLELQAHRLPGRGLEPPIRPVGRSRGGGLHRLGRGEDRVARPARRSRHLRAEPGAVAGDQRERGILALPTRQRAAAGALEGAVREQVRPRRGGRRRQGRHGCCDRHCCRSSAHSPSLAGTGGSLAARCLPGRGRPGARSSEVHAGAHIRCAGGLAEEGRDTKSLLRCAKECVLVVAWRP